MTPIIVTSAGDAAFNKDDTCATQAADCAPLPPANPDTFPFPRLARLAHEDEAAVPAPYFPLFGTPQRVATWAARIGSQRWLDAERAGQLCCLEADVFVWAIVDSALER